MSYAVGDRWTETLDEPMALVDGRRIKQITYEVTEIRELPDGSILEISQSVDFRTEP